MGRVVAVAIIVGMIFVGGGFLYTQYASQQSAARTAAALKDVREGFVEVVRPAISVEDDGEYRRQLRTALANYDRQLARVVYQERPDLRDLEAFKAKVADQFSRGKIDEHRRDSALEGYRIVAEAYETLKKGRWKSVLTKAGAKDTRLDIYEIRRVLDRTGTPRLEARFMLWGVDDPAEVNWGELRMRFWKTVHKKVRRGRRRVVEDVDQVFATSDTSARPYVVIHKPERFIAEFPSYVSVGALRLSVVPPEANRFDITYTYTVNRRGNRTDAVLKWSQLPVPPGWQLREGETWEADVRDATPEEIAGEGE